MKYIPTNDTIILLQHVAEKSLNERLLKRMLEQYGDDYFIKDGEMKLFKENEKRKELLQKLQDTN